MSDYVIHRETDELQHYGVKGTHWGIRRYQNLDGSYKPGAEGRYYTPVGDKVRKSMAAAKSAASEARSQASVAMKKIFGNSKSTTGGGGGAAKKEEQPINKTVLGKDIDVKDASQKLDTSSTKEKKSSTKKAKDESAGNEEFKLSQLEDKINNLFDMDDMKDEDWEDMDLDQSDIDEIDNLITKYRIWRKGNKSNTKKLKKIDEFIERYESWKSGHSKHSEMRELYLMHHGVLGMHWGIRRYQNKNGSLTEAGKQRYLKNVKKTGTYDSINWDSGTIKERRAKSKEREFMQKVNKDFTKMYEASYDDFCDSFNKLTRSIDTETLDTLEKVRNHHGGDDHYLEQETFDNFQKRYSDCGNENQLKKVFDYCEAVNRAGDEHTKFMLDYMTNYVEYLGFTNSEDQEQVKRYLKSAYGIF